MIVKDSSKCLWFVSCLVASSQAKGTKSTSFLTYEVNLVPLACIRNKVDLVPLACEDGLVVIDCSSVTSGHVFLCAFCAPCLETGAFLMTSLITPTATTCLESRTANLPSGGYWWKASTHIGLLGTIVTKPESPCFRLFGVVFQYFGWRVCLLFLLFPGIYKRYGLYGSRGLGYTHS